MTTDKCSECGEIAGQNHMCDTCDETFREMEREALLHAEWLNEQEES